MGKTQDNFIIYPLFFFIMNEQIIEILTEIRDSLKKMQPKERTTLDKRFERKARREG